jgi:hypothetical protein
MGTKFLEVVYDEHGIGGSGEYCGDNDAHLDRIRLFLPRTSYLQAISTTGRAVIRWTPSFGRWVRRARHWRQR